MIDQHKKSGVCLIGAYPPPVHGMSMVNSYVAASVALIGDSVIVDVSPKSLSRGWMNRTTKLQKVLKGIGLSFRTRNSWESMYVGLSGGAGQIYEIIFILLARVLKKKIFLHHHSFAYLDRKSLITSLLIKVGGTLATHIVLCCKMGIELRSRYQSVQNIFVLSNSAIMEVRLEARTPKSSLKTLGYLSNICKEKGIFHFLDVLESLLSIGIEVKGIIAGPYQDEKTKLEVEERLHSLPNVEYVGPKYDEEKVAFFGQIDVLLFPTSYANEAEPLVLYEAISEGIPVIAWDRGCISEMLSPDVGLLIGRSENFRDVTISKIREWVNDQRSLHEASKRASERYLFLQKQWKSEYEKLLLRMTE